MRMHSLPFPKSIDRGDLQCAQLICSFTSSPSQLFLSPRRYRRRTADTFRPVVRGKRGVVAGGSPLSVEAGLRILRQGGNAVDAGVATILAASVIEFSHFSFGGEVPILIKLKARMSLWSRAWASHRGKPRANSSLIAPRQKQKANQPRPIQPAAQRGSLDLPSIAGARPGLIPSTGHSPQLCPPCSMHCVAALDQFGTKSLSEVIQPAIELADGFPIDELRVEYIKTRTPIISQWPDAKRVFLPNGEIPRVGTSLSKPILRALCVRLPAPKRLRRGKSPLRIDGSTRLFLSRSNR